MLSDAKLAYLLSTCPKLNNSLMSAMIKQYAQSKTVATRHYFELWITLYEPKNISRYNMDPTKLFSVKNTRLKFMNMEDNVVNDALQFYNVSVLSNAEIQLIKSNLVKNGIKLNDQQIISIYSIAVLIKEYKKSGFKYVFIPVIIDYGRGGGVVHQTALIIDIKEYNFIYYEPYGLYTKYEKSYKEAIGTLMHCFDRLLNTSMKYITYHDLLSHKQGIQAILIENNNKNAADYDANYNNIVETLSREFPKVKFISDKFNNSKDLTDKTLSILDLLFNVDNFNIDELSEEKKHIYYNVLENVIEQYYCYNSKTCVSITIVEMNKFFSYIENDYNIDEISKKIGDMYTEYYDKKFPNQILMKDIYKMLDLFRDTVKIQNIIDNGKQIFKICEII